MSFMLSTDCMLHSARNASVPVAVHLDHATDPEHIELALSLAERGIAFDSIMVDASHADVSTNGLMRTFWCPTNVRLG